MEIIRWANGQGYTIRLDLLELAELETAIEAARIMHEWGELRTARDVFDFIDSTHNYDKVMKQYIDETLEEYDYEAKEEVAKE